MNKIKQLAENKIFKIGMTIFKVIVTIIFICFIFVVYLQRFSNNKISFFNYRMFTVVSGSMVPKYNIGDVLISKETEPSKIKIGDTISYLGQKGDFKDKVITHEVVNIEGDKKDGYFFHTKGLTSIVIDPIVPEKQVYGVIVYKTVVLSTIYKVVSSQWGFYLCIVLPLMFIIGSEIVSSKLSKYEK